MDNKRVEELEIIVNRLMRRTGKRTSALITPYPISGAVFGELVKGSVIRYMFPCEGKITKFMVRLGSKPKNPVVINIKSFNDLSAKANGYAIDKKITNIQLDISTGAGDCLDVTIDPKEETVTECWVSFLWTPLIREVEAKSFLMKEMEDDIQKRELPLTI